jgi:hypothetical protein
MLNLYLECLPTAVTAYWIIKGPDGRIFTHHLNCVDRHTGKNLPISDVIKWILKNTPIASADEVYIDCKEYNLLDENFWHGWGVGRETYFDRWETASRPTKEKEAE